MTRGSILAALLLALAASPAALAQDPPDEMRLLWSQTVGPRQTLRVLIPAGREPDGAPEAVFLATPRRLWAAEPETGEPIWIFRSHGRVTLAPVWSGGRLVVVDGAGIHGLDPTTGWPVWRVALEQRIPSLDTDGEGVYVLSGSGADEVDLKLVRISGASGRTQWSRVIRARDCAPLLHTKETVFVQTLERPQTLLALDAATGEDRFRIDAGEAGFGMMPFLVGGDLAICPNGDRNLLVVDGVSGENRLSIELPEGSSPESGHAVLGNFVITIAGGAVLCFESATGEMRWGAPPEGEPGCPGEEPGVDCFFRILVRRAGGRPRSYSVQAWDMLTGARLWETRIWKDVGEDELEGVIPTLLLRGDLLIVHMCRCRPPCEHPGSKTLILDRRDGGVVAQPLTGDLDRAVLLGDRLLLTEERGNRVEVYALPDSD